MNRQSKRKGRKIKQRHSAKPTAQAGSGGSSQVKEIWRDLLKGLLFIALVMALKFMIEQTVFGKQFHLMSYNLLQLQLTAESAPVTIVDISDLEAAEFNVNGQRGKATPREPLRKMIEAISEHHPKAIGVDIDFSPDENGYIHPQDPDFFQFCLDLQKQRGVPIFLGIKRSMIKPAPEWLGSEKYQDLAANILIPNDSRRMLSEINVTGELKPGETAAVSKPSKAMSFVLADAYRQEQNDDPERVHHFRDSIIEGLRRIGFIEKISEKQLGPGLTVKDIPVDFSPLESIELLRTIDPVVLRDQSQRQKFQGQIVLIGDGALNKSTDKFSVPAREQLYPGIFLHACAIYTLIKAPLYEVTGYGRLALDILFAVAILLIISSIRFYYLNRTPEEVAKHRLQGFFTVLIVVMVIIAGVVFVRATRIVWDDFFLALTALIFHPSIERHLKPLWKQITKHIPAAFHRLVFKRRESPR